MTNPFYAALYEKIMPQLAELGFRSYRKRYYYRIVGDVVQQFAALTLNHRYTVRYEIGSVFDDNRRVSEGEEITWLIDRSNGFLVEDTVFVPEKQMYVWSPKTFEEAVQICADGIWTHLIPYFEKTRSPEATLQTMLTDEVLRWERMRQYPWPPEMPPKPEGKFDIRHLGLLLSLCRYEDARTVLDEIVADEAALRMRWWWQKMMDDLIALRLALIEGDEAGIRAYEDKTRLATYREFKWPMPKK